MTPNDPAAEIARIALEMSDEIADKVVAGLREWGVCDERTEQSFRAICYAEALRHVLERVGIPTTVTYPKGW